MYNNIRELRKGKGLTLLDMEVICGISQSNLSLIERCRVKPIKRTLNKLSKVLGEIKIENHE